MNKYFPWIVAILAHAVVVSAILVSTRPQQPVASSDFTAEAGLISVEILPPGPIFPSTITDLTEFQDKVCAVHKVEMTPKEVPIAYGLLDRIADPERFA